MSKTITISDETAQILDTLVRDGQFDSEEAALEEFIQSIARPGFNAEFVAGLREAIRQAESGLALPGSEELVRDAFNRARKEYESTRRE